MHTKELVLSYLSPALAGLLAGQSETYFGQLTALRIRIGRPLLVYRHGRESAFAYTPTAADLADTMERICRHSMYAMEEELRNGYVTVAGGHRVGLTGKVVYDGQGVKTIRPINGLNFRICREVKGCADALLPRIIGADGKALNTLLVSPPGCGKTTLLRDIIRQWSDGGLTVGVVDERSEIGGSYRGVPQNDVGRRTDLLDGCPKEEGMMLLLRAMAPDVIAVDELGGERDARAVEAVSNAGVRLLCTVHGADIADLRQKPSLAPLLAKRIFKRLVVLGAPGEIKEVVFE